MASGIDVNLVITTRVYRSRQPDVELSVGTELVAADVAGQNRATRDTLTAMLKPLHDQVIVLTGASSGIGLATAEAAAKLGARLVLVARNGDALDRVATKLGKRVVAVIADIAEAESAERIAETALTAFGHVDTWVNAAAAAIYGNLTETTEADHRRVFDVGYFGTVRASLKAVELLSNRGGALINVGSVLGERTIVLQGTYSAMKHALRAFTDALRMEVEAEGRPIAVTLIKPAGMNTPYPEHARNLTGSPVRIPPIVYDPRLAATAILHAAQHKTRELTVGGVGIPLQKLSNLFPRLTDLGMEMVGKAIQHIDQPPEPDAVDNLHHPRPDGRIDSNQDIYVRRTSLWLAAQMNPVRAAGAVGAGILAAMMLAAGRRR